MSKWNDLTTANLRSAADYNMFVDALVERGYPSGSLASATAGAVGQSASWATQLQQAIIKMLDGKLTTLTPPPYSPRWFNTNNLAGITASNYGASYLWDWASMNAAILGGNGFTRKRPLEFATLASGTYDYSGAAFANGDTARCLADGKIYDRVAGAWVLSSSPVPDIYTVNNAAGATDDLKNGIAQADDYGGSWIYTELRDIINQMIHRQESFNGWGSVTNNSNTGFSFANAPYATLAAAEADAEADYDGGTNLSTDSTSGGVPTTTAQTFPDTGSGYTASLARVAKKINADGLLTTVTKTVRYFCSAKRFAHDEWDGNGDFTTEGVWQLISSESETAAATTSQSALIGNMSTKPAWPTTLGDTRGYDADDVNSPAIIATYDFAYGPGT